LLQDKTLALAYVLRNCISLSRNWHVMDEESENLLSGANQPCKGNFLPCVACEQ